MLHLRVERELLSLLGNAEDDKLFRLDHLAGFLCSHTSTQSKLSGKNLVALSQR